MSKRSETRRLEQRCILASLPSLSDEAALQIHDLLIQVTDLFEARYGEQIDRFYENLHFEDQFEQQPAPGRDDQPF